jgi:hypothetical protein
MASTTIKLSVETRDRLKAMGGATYEETIIEALDALDAQQFWAEAEAAAAWRASQPPEVQARMRAEEDALDAALDRLSGEC